MTEPARPDIPAVPAPVSGAAVQAALDAVAQYWREAHAVLQAYPSAQLARTMLEAAAPLIRADDEAKLAEIADLCRKHPRTLAAEDVLRITNSEGEPAGAELAALREALRGHMHSFTDHAGVVLCGGCLRPSPCPDAALAETYERNDHGH